MIDSMAQTGRRDDAGWLARWMAWRNRLIADPKFQAWSLRNPLTRLIARRHARRLFDLTAGFVYSQVTAAMVESGLLRALAERPLTVGECAGVAGLRTEATQTLLLAAASLDLTEATGARWTLGQTGAALLGTPGLQAMIGHHRLFYDDCADPLAMLRREGTGRLARLWEYGPDGAPEDAQTYSELMSATQPMVAAQALAAYPFERHCRLLDIGGGQGRFLDSIAAAHPHLEMGLFDRADVLRGADEKHPAHTLHRGDFLRDSLPPGYDLHSLVRVLHDHDDAPAMDLLRASRAALEPGGRLVIVEPMAQRGRAPECHAYFGFYLAAMRSGRPREAREIREMLRSAGFSKVRERATPLPLIARFIEAKT